MLIYKQYIDVLKRVKYDMKIQLMVLVMGIWVALGLNAVADVVQSITTPPDVRVSNRPSLPNLIPPDTVFYGDEYYDMDGGEALDVEISERIVADGATEMSERDRAISRRTPLQLGFSDVVKRFNQMANREGDASDTNDNASSPSNDLEFGVYDFD